MRSLLLQAGDFTVSIPRTTQGQYAIGAVVIFALLGGSILWYFLSRKAGMEADEKQIREDAHAQRRNQSPASLQYPSSVIKEGLALSHELAGLLEKTDDPKATRSTVPGALKEVYQSISVAWSGRVGDIPRLARRGIWLAIWVTVTGSVAVSTGAVINLLSSDPSAPTMSAALDAVTRSADRGVDVVGAFPYGGTLWSLAVAYAILAAQWLFNHWWVVALTLAVSAVSITILDRRLDEADVPNQVINSRAAVVAGAAVSAGLVWIVGAGIATAGARLPEVVVGSVPALPVAIGGGLVAVSVFTGDSKSVGPATGIVLSTGASVISGPEWPAVLGFSLSILLAVFLGYRFLPRFGQRLWSNIQWVAGEHTRPVAGYLVIQRALSVLSVAGAILVGAYILVGVSNGQWGHVVSAFLEAPAEVQAGVVLGLVSAVALVAYAIADAWTDVRAALHATFAQQAVRVQLLRRALPGFVVFLAYVVVWTLTSRFFVSIGVALVGGLAFQKFLTLATEAAYRADGRSILKKMLRPEPLFVSWLAYELEIAGQTYYLIEVNGRKLLSNDRDDVIQAAVTVGTALATNEEPPATDESWFAEFVFDHGIADPDDWDHKLDEKIRKAVFDTLRVVELPIIGRRSGGNVTRAKLDQELADFDDSRVRARLYDRDINPFITLGDEYVTLDRDPFKTEDRREWPTFGE